MSRDAAPDVHRACDAGTPCDRTTCETRRRRVLGVLGAGVTAGLAGCTGLLAVPDEPTIRGEDEAYWVDFLREEERVEMLAKQTVLRAAEDAGIEIPYFCRAGFCGVCLSRADGDATEVVDMAINDFDPLTEDAVEAGYFLPCTSQPRADFAVQTQVDAEALEEFADEEDDEDDEEDEAVGDVHPVRFEEQEGTIYVPENRDLLGTAEDAGYELPYQCREGWCGQCLSRADEDANEVIEHTVNDYEPLDDDAMADGYLLTCTGQPRDGFTVETGKAGDLD